MTRQDKFITLFMLDAGRSNIQNATQMIQQIKCFEVISQFFRFPTKKRNRVINEAEMWSAVLCLAAISEQLLIKSFS